MAYIVIRKATAGDVTGISRMIKAGLRRNTWQFTAISSYTNRNAEQLRNALSSKSPALALFVAVDKDHKGLIVGSVSYDFSKVGRLRHRIGLGWGVHPNYAGRGIGTRLLKFAVADAKNRGYKRAEAEMAVKNTVSWKMALKCGFKIEGRKRKGLYTDDGKYVDTYIIGKLL